MRFSARLGLAIAGLTLMAGMAERSEAAVVYQLQGGNDIVQQAGNAQYYYGDDVTLPAGGPLRLDAVTLAYALFTNEGTGSYIPNLSLDIFAINPSTRLPQGSALGTATRNDVTFV